MTSINKINFNKGYYKRWGKKAERIRILSLLELEMICECEDAMGHLKQRIEGENNQTGKEFDYFETPFDDVQDVRSSDYIYGWDDCAQRIIKLLINTEEGNTAMGMAIYLGDNRGVIALIKGENNH